MVRRCCVAGCNSTSGLHNFPLDLEIRRQWLHALGLEDHELLSFAVCNLYFTRDFFSNAMEVEMGFSTQQCRSLDHILSKRLKLIWLWFVPSISAGLCPFFKYCQWVESGSDHQGFSYPLTRILLIKT